MNFQEAQQIYNSPEYIEVLHRGKSVWIDDLNSLNHTASVSAGERRYSVPVEELVRG